MKQTLLIIGSGPGLARATARRFGRENFKVVLSARRREALAAEVELLRKEGIDASFEVADAGSLSAMSGLVGRVLEAHGGIDVFCYNAAALGLATLLQTSQEKIASDLLVNVGGAMAALQAAVPAMKKKGKGTVLLTGGGLVVNPQANLVSLTVGKFALRGLYKCLAIDSDCADLHIAHVLVEAKITQEVARVLADAYWELHCEPREKWRRELLFDRVAGWIEPPR